MKQQDKELLLRDLCARLPHSVMIQYYNCEPLQVVGVSGCFVEIGGLRVNFDECKPYLRPMSSMTKEEGYEFYEISGFQCYDDLFACKKLAKKQSFIGDTLDWLNSHHFDYRGLIEKGLALEAPDGMYDFK